MAEQGAGSSWTRRARSGVNDEALHAVAAAAPEGTEASGLDAPVTQG